jgi:hypothetical protein
MICGATHGPARFSRYSVGWSTVTRGTSAAAAVAGVEERHPDRLRRQRGAGVGDQVLHPGRRGGAGHVVGHHERALVVDERKVQHDGVDAGVGGLQRRTVEEFDPRAATEGPDRVAGGGETGDDRRAL